MCFLFRTIFTLGIIFASYFQSPFLQNRVLMDMELQGQIVIYSTSGCPHCKASKSKLDSLNLPYVDINLDDYPDQQEKMTSLTGKHTVPQIFFNDLHVGGNEDFQNLSDERLKELITYVQEQSAPESAPNFELQSSSKTSDGDKDLYTKDELAGLVEKLSSQSDIVHAHRHNFFSSIPRAFTGSDLVSFVARECSVIRDEALKLAQKLLEKKFVIAIEKDMPIKDNGTLYRLIHDLPSKALNANMPAYLAIVSASQLSMLIRKTILKLYSEHLSKNGKRVDYTGISRSPDFTEYKQLTAQLNRVHLNDLSRDEKLAFFINIYNALVIHGNIALGFPKSVYSRYKFFNNAQYLIGGHSYSLQDIENGVLRSNRKGVGMLKKPFSKNDPRLEFILSPHEPLIHFALVCGAKSCPPIKTYSPENIMKQLELSTTSFLESNDGCRVNTETNMIGLSMIFKWYKEDFGANEDEVLNWVENHMADSSKKNDMLSIMEKKTFKLVYLTYDWNVNEK